MTTTLARERAMHRRLRLPLRQALTERTAYTDRVRRLLRGSGGHADPKLVWLRWEQGWSAEDVAASFREKS
jgi:hypothetical protein